MEIQFTNADRAARLRYKDELKAHLSGLFKRMRTKASSLQYVFCSDAYLLNINQEFLRHDEYTDIITFDLAEKGRPIEGEVYISIDRIADNSKSLGVPYQDELLRVIFHGALHLCGYTDKSVMAKQAMTKAEDAEIARFIKNVSRGT